MIVIRVRRVDRAILAVVGIIQDHRAAGQVDLVVHQSGDVWQVDVGELIRAAPFVEDDLTVTGQFKVLTDRQRIGEGDKHPFKRLEVSVDRCGRRGQIAAGQARHRQLDGGRCGQGVASANHHDATGGRGRQLAHRIEVGSTAGDLYFVTHGDGGWATAAEDKDPFRGGRIGIAVPILFLEEEAAQLAAALGLIVAHHNRLDDEGAAAGDVVAAALDRADLGDRRRRGREVPGGRIGNAGEVIAIRVLERPGGDVDIIGRVEGQVCRRVDCHLGTADGDVGAGHINRLHHRVVDRQVDRDVACAFLHSFIKGDHQVLTNRHPCRTVSGIERANRWSGGIDGKVDRVHAPARRRTRAGAGRAIAEGKVDLGARDARQIDDTGVHKGAGAGG